MERLEFEVVEIHLDAQTQSLLRRMVDRTHAARISVSRVAREERREQAAAEIAERIEGLPIGFHAPQVAGTGEGRIQASELDRGGGERQRLGGALPRRAPPTPHRVLFAAPP